MPCKDLTWTCYQGRRKKEKQTSQKQQHLSYIDYLLRRSSATAESTTELRPVLTRSTSLLTAVSTTATTFTVETTRRARVALQGAGRLLKSGRHNLGRQVQVLTKEFNTLVSQEPVVMAPSVTLGDVLLRLHALHKLDNLKVSNALNLRVSGGVEVLLGVQDTLCKVDKTNLKFSSRRWERFEIINE